MEDKRYRDHTREVTHFKKLTPLLEFLYVEYVESYLREQLKIQRVHKKLYIDALCNICLNVVRADDNFVDQVRLSLDNNIYKLKLYHNCNQRKKLNTVNYKHLRNAIDALEYYSLVKLVIGKNKIEATTYDRMLGIQQTDPTSSFLHFSDKFIKMVKEYTDNTSIKPKNNVIYVRKRDYDKPKVGGKFPMIDVTIQIDEEVQETIDFLLNYNEFMTYQDVKLESESLRVQLKKIYRNSFDGGGRSYTEGGEVQSLPQVSRKGLKINGKNVVEIDYSATHYRMIAELSQYILDRDFDPYGCNPADFPREDYRMLNKYIGMVVLGSTSFERCWKLVEEHFLTHRTLYSDMLEMEHFNTGALNAIKYKTLPETLDIEKVVGDFIEHNHYAEEWFYKRRWHVLQKYDSLIADGVVSRFLAEGKPIIPIHDSFIAIESDKSFLAQSMYDSWNDTLNAGFNCKLSLK